MVSFTPALTDKHSIILADIFSKSSLHLQIPTQAESQSQRDIAFYDETLLVNLVLSLPVSNALPPPPDPSPSNLDLTTLVPLPIPPPSPSSPHPQVPLLLSALLSSLHVGLFADYVPSNPSSQAPNSFNPYTPLPTIPTSQIAYQRSTDASQQPGGQGSSDSVQCFSTSWEGNKVAPRNVEKREEEDQAGDFRGLISFQDQRWKVQWYCDLPVVFMNTSFARPLLSVTSSLTLRLAPKIMSHLFSTPVASQFSHSLLSPLHEGPIYPDESPTERLARSRASSALGLDGPNGLGSRLAELPNDVLGTKLVTPKFGEKALAEVEVRRNRALAAQVIVPSKPKAREEEVDLAGEDLGRIGLQVRPKGGKASRGGSDEEEEAKEREEEVVPTLQVLKRSVRKVLDVRSGLSVRMRTVYAVPPPNTQERYKRLAGDSLSLEADHGENGTEQDSDSNALVLCVELENGLHTGLDFLVEGVDIRVGGGQADDEESESEVSVKLLDQGDHQPFPLRLAQGDQRNLLYYVQLDPSLQWPRERPPAGFRRNFGIVVTGKPIILSPSKATSSADARDEAGVDLITPTASFPSRWNCNLDLTSLASARERRSRLSADEAPPEMNLNSSERALQNLGIAGSARHSALALEQAYLADRLSCGGNPNVEGNPNRRQPRLPTTTPFTEANQGPSTPVRTVSGQMGPSNASRNYPPSLSLSGMRRPSNWSTGPVRTPTSASVGLSATHGGFADRAISIYQPDTTTPQTPRTPTTWNGGMLSRARSRAASAAAAAATAAVSKDSFGEDHRNTGPLWEQASGGFDLESITDRRASLPRNRAESQVFSHHHHHQRLSGANGWGSRDLWPWSERHEGGASSGSRPDSTGFLHQQSRTEERYSQDTQQQQQQQQLLRYRQRSTVGTALGMLAISCRMIKDADSHHHGRPPLDHRRNPPMPGEEVGFQGRRDEMKANGIGDEIASEVPGEEEGSDKRISSITFHSNRKGEDGEIESRALTSSDIDGVVAAEKGEIADLDGEGRVARCNLFNDLRAEASSVFKVSQVVALELYLSLKAPIPEANGVGPGTHLPNGPESDEVVESMPASRGIHSDPMNQGMMDLGVRPPAGGKSLTVYFSWWEEETEQAEAEGEGEGEKGMGPRPLDGDSIDGGSVDSGPSSSVGGGRTRLMDTEVPILGRFPTSSHQPGFFPPQYVPAARKRHFQLRHQIDKTSGLIPLENHVSLGPIQAGTSEMARIRLFCLSKGLHEVPPLSMTLVDPWDGHVLQEKILRGVGQVYVVE